MNATVAELQQGASEIIRAVVQRGEEIVLTDAGEPVAKIIPFMRTITVHPDTARAEGQLTDEAILTAIHEAREASVDRLQR
jgi:prevent-host-death family protein